MKLGGKVTPGETHIAVSGSLAAVSNIEKGENVVDGETVEVSIRATTTLRRESGQWKVIGHHTDLLPFLSE